MDVAVPVAGPQFRGRAGPPPGAAFRQAVLGSKKPQTRPPQPVGDIVHAFLTTHPAADFYPPLAKEIDRDK